MNSDVTSSRGPLTVGEALRKSTAYLEAKGRESSRLSAELLLAHVLATDRLNVYLRFETVLEDSQIGRLRDLLARRGRGEPVAYLLGRKEFMGLTFEVNASVLIPRPDTELLVQYVSGAIGAQGRARILDLGCGSGNIAVSILHSCPNAVGFAVDHSPAAIELTRRNAQQQGVANRLTVIEGSLYSGLSDAERGSFDWVCSNPPYICDDEWAALAIEIRQFEPPDALRGGPDGLLVYRPLVAEAPQWLRPGGRIALEISPRVRQGVIELLVQSGFQSIEVQKDLGGQPRLVVACGPDT